MKVKLVVTDLDDTLLRDDRTISERSRKTIQRAVERGIHVAIATGRMYDSAVPYARQLGLKGPILCCQGAQIADIETGAEIHTQGIPQELARDVMRWAEGKGLYIQYYSLSDYYFEHQCEQSDLYRRLCGVAGKALGAPCSRTLGIDPIKLLIIADPAEIRAAFEQAKELWKGKLEIAISKPNYLELTHPDANKGKAMLRLAGMLGVEPEAVMAVGDALNDLPMILSAGLGVAVGNGAETVRAQANRVTLSNEEDGVAAAIEQYALEE